MELREHVPLAPYTTFGLGGKARLFVECGSEDEVRAALAYAAERRLLAYVLGGGSNVVFLDSGFRTHPAPHHRWDRVARRAEP